MLTFIILYGVAGFLTLSAFSEDTTEHVSSGKKKKKHRVKDEVIIVHNSYTKLVISSRSSG
jgi:hypothetical protein